MDLYYDDIIINEKKLINKGKINIDSNTINIICGENGSGKTLLMKNIANNKKNRTKEIVLLDQNNNVTISTCNIIQSIAISDDPNTVMAMEKALQKLELGYLVQLKNGHLSGGEQRIVNILRCFFCKSDIVILDEPTNDLDYKIVEKLIELLKSLREKKTILIVSHDDRMLNISNSIFFVSSNEVKKKKSDDCNQCCNRNTTNFETFEIKKNIQFVSTLFRYNAVCVLTFLIFAIIIFIQVHSYMSCLSITSPNDILRDDEILLCSYYSDEFEYCNGGNNVLPLFAVEPLMNLNIFENVRIINEITEFTNSPNIEIYDFILQDSKYYSVFPVEFFSKENNGTINVLSYYVDNYFSSENKDIWVDSFPYFTNIDCVEDEENCTKVQLDISKYINCLNELRKDDSLIISAEIVVLNNKCTTSKFYSLDEIKNLAQHDILVYSNEIHKLTDQVNIFKNLWRGLIIIIASIFVLILVNIVYLCMLMLNKRELVYLLRNYNYSQEEVLRVIKNRINNRKPLLVVLFIFGIALIIYMRDMAFSQATFIFFFSAMFYCSLLYEVNDLLISKYISMFYRWNSR